MVERVALGLAVLGPHDDRLRPAARGKADLGRTAQDVVERVHLPVAAVPAVKGLAVDVVQGQARSRIDALAADAVAEDVVPVVHRYAAASVCYGEAVALQV